MIKFLIQSKKSPAGIYVRVTDGKVDVKARTKFVVNPTDWSNAKGSVKHRKNEELRQLDEKLVKLLSELRKRFNQASEQREVIDTFWLKNFLNPVIGPANEPDGLLDYIKSYIKRNTEIKSHSAIEKITQLESKIIRFQTYKKKSYLIKDVGSIFLTEFFAYLKNIQLYGENTAAKACKFLKTICLDAQKNGLEINPDIRGFKVKQKKSIPLYFNKKDLYQLLELQIEDKLLQYVRDWLLLSCCTAQRVSDLMRNDFSELQEDDDGILTLQFVQKKTGDEIKFPLPKAAVEILKKYDNSFPPPIPYHKYNELIKEVCRLAGFNEIMNGSKSECISVKKIKNIKSRERVRKISGKFRRYELITSHIGRRSFATNFSYVWPSRMVCAFTGHTTESQLNIYIGKSTDSYQQTLKDLLYPDLKKTSDDKFWGF